MKRENSDDNYRLQKKKRKYFDYEGQRERLIYKEANKWVGNKQALEMSMTFVKDNDNRETINYVGISKKTSLKAVHERVARHCWMKQLIKIIWDGKCSLWISSEYNQEIEGSNSGNPSMEMR